MNFLKPGYTIAAIWIFIVLTSLQYHLAPGQLNVITWDVYGYYLYLPAIFKYGDTSQYQFAIDHLNSYNFSSDLYQILEWKDGYAPIYTIGMAIIYLPFYLLADVIATIVPGIKADGLSPIYQWAIIVASWIYVLIGMLYTVKLLKALKFSGFVISFCLIIIFLGTNLYHYSAFENGMPHLYLYSLYAILTYLTVMWHKDNRWSYIISGGIIIALMCLIRPSEVIAIIIPLAFGVYNGLSFLIKINRIIKNRRQILMMITIGLSIVMLQVIYWKLNINEWIFNGYQGHHFDWLKPHLWNGLFSYRKGWLLYSPLCALSIIGIPLLWKRDKRFFFPILIFFILNLYVVFSWHIWWYASSFGMRALVQSYALLVIPMATIIEWISIRKVISIIVLSGLVLLIGLNLFQDWQYRNKILLQDEMNKTFYWKSFLMVTEDKTLRKFIDNQDEYTENASPILISTYTPNQNDITTTADTILPGKFSFTHRIPFSNMDINENSNWFKIVAEVKVTSDQFSAHDQARLVSAIKNLDDNLKWTGVRFQSFSELGEWEKIFYDFDAGLNNNRDNYLEVTIWNNGPDTIYLKSLDVYNYH